MKNRLSSFAKAVTGSESCTICMVAMTILAAVVIWKVIGMLHGHIIEYASMQDFTVWRR
jgi:ABC-type xylose transport system permease subunit